MFNLYKANYFPEFNHAILTLNSRMPCSSFSTQGVSHSPKLTWSQIEKSYHSLHLTAKSLRAQNKTSPSPYSWGFGSQAVVDHIVGTQ